MGARGRRGAAALALMTLVSLVSLATGQDGESDGTPTGPACSLTTLELCEDKCTLDGQRESPCELECDPESGLCYDKCAAYSVDLALEDDVFDATCANRLASREAREFVADADQSPLREPPQVTAGLSSVPFSMFRNGLLHTGRSDHPGPSVARVAWTYKTGGRVFSSPTLASDGTVYVGCTDGFVYGVQSSGVIKWKYPAGGPVVSTAAIGNPIGSDTTLFMGGSDGTLHAVSANYGTSKWSYIRPQLHLNGKWQMRAKRPIVSSAALAPEGIVYIGADTALYALNAATGSGGFSGTVKWAYETRGLIMGSPALDRDGRIFVGSMDGSLYALRQSDGGFIWQFDAEGGLYSSPALDGEGRLYVGSVDSYLYALDSATGRLAWKFRASAAIYSSPAISPGGPEGGGLVFVGCTDWKLYAVRQRDGLLAWNQTLRRAPPEEAPPPPAPPAPPSQPPTPGPPSPSDGSAAASPPPPATSPRAKAPRHRTSSRTNARGARRRPSSRRRACVRPTWRRARARRLRFGSDGTRCSPAGETRARRAWWRRRCIRRTDWCTWGAPIRIFTRWKIARGRCDGPCSPTGRCSPRRRWTRMGNCSSRRMRGPSIRLRTRRREDDEG